MVVTVEAGAGATAGRAASMGEGVVVVVFAVTVDASLAAPSCTSRMGHLYHLSELPRESY